MYKKTSSGWLKHLDFMLIDLACLHISFIIAYMIRHGLAMPYRNAIYLNMSIIISLIEVVITVFMETLKNVLKRGYYEEAVSTVKHVCMVVLFATFYMFVTHEGDAYSRMTLLLMGPIYGVLTYIMRILWKRFLLKRMAGDGKRSLVIVTTMSLVNHVIENIHRHNYEMFTVKGIAVVDRDMTGKTIDGVDVIANKETVIEYVCREWVDEVFINLPKSNPFPDHLINKFVEMGVTVHMKLAKVSKLEGQKQFVERMGNYTVLTTSINTASTRQLFLKRALDIVGGLAGCLITLILCIFIGPAIYIQSPGPIFFSQVRVGKGGRRFKIYKFRSMYMDAEERKKELMKENRVKNGMMFKLDFDPRIIGSKKLPGGKIKKGVGNIIRDLSLDEFPQFFNVLKGDMSLVGNCYIIGTTKKNPVFSSVCPIG